MADWILPGVRPHKEKIKFSNSVWKIYHLWYNPYSAKREEMRYGLRYRNEPERLPKRKRNLLEAFSGIYWGNSEKSSKVIDDLVEERHRQGLTQQDIADMTGIRTSNVARLEKGKRIPTLIILQKYASALGKHIEVKVCEGTEE